MHGLGLLHRWALSACWLVHRGRLQALMKAVAALLAGNKLSVTHRERHLSGATLRKHQIKCMDRLLGNGHLHRERIAIYRAMSQWLLPRTALPVIVVDWSDCAPGRDWVLLRAAVPVRGRAIAIWEEVHPLSAYNSPGVHRDFLTRLAFVVPSTCRPILVTDAGFRWHPDRAHRSVIRV